MRPRHLTILIVKFFRKRSTDDNDSTSKLYLFAWDKICRTKIDGGLGIKRMQDVNL